MGTLKKDLPNVRIIFIANCDIKTEIVNGIKEAGEYFGCDVVELKCIEKYYGHPTIKGMKQISEQVLNCFGV